MAGLVYEVAWVKALGLFFGHTVYAVAVVLAVFMAGLAAGSAYLGRWSERSANAVSLYARLEFLAGLTGALSLAGLHEVHSLYVALYPAVSGSPFVLLLGMRFLGAVVVLFIPTFLMGGTFPILVSGTAQSSGEVAKRVSQLYWSNTAGAVLGTVLAGFALLPTLGLRLTIITAAALNGIAGLLALFVRTRTPHPETKNRNLLQLQKVAASNVQPRRPYVLLVLFGLVGCSAFAYEIAWTRLLAIAIGSSTYAFTLMLATFLAGMAIGSLLFQIFSSRSGPISLTAFGWVQAGIALAVVSSLIVFHWIPGLIPPLLRATDRTFAGLLLTQFVTTALTVFPAAILFGFNFPMIVDLIRRRASGLWHTSASVGAAYAANTVGAIVGSVTTGFWLISRWGSFRVIVVVAAINLLLAILIHLSLPRRQLVALAAEGVLLTGAFLIGSSPFFDNQSLLTLSAVLYGASYQGHLTLSEIAATKDLVFSAEGVNDSVAVVRTDGDVALRLNGKVDASTQDTPTQLLLGHLGAAFHHSPRRVLVIGFGSGMTVAALARYPDVERIDCVEIELAVIRAAPYFAALNRNVLADRRLHIVFDDARNFLLTSREKYDLIISEPSNPWIAGIATLFTDEYYATARQRLQRGGVFVQWVQAYSLAPADLRMIMGTFARHFSNVTLWRAGETDFLLLGRTDASAFAFNRLQSLWGNAELREDFTSLHVEEPEGLVAYFLLDDEEVRQLASGATLNTDDRTLLEYHAPRSLLASDLIDVDQALIARLHANALPRLLKPSENRRALAAGLNTALDINDTVKAASFLEALKSEPETPTLNIAKGRLSLARNSLPEARTLFEKAFGLDRGSPEPAYWLAVVERRSGDDAAALSRISQVTQLHPHFLPALEEQMELAAAGGDYQTALSAQLRRMGLMRNPPAYEYGRLGALWLNTFNFTEAEATLVKGLAKDAYCYACHFELGELYVRIGNFPRARQNFRWVVRFFPDSDAAAFRSLVAIDLLLKDTESAKAVLAEGLRVFPNDAGLLKAQAALGA